MVQSFQRRRHHYPDKCSRPHALSLSLSLSLFNPKSHVHALSCSKFNPERDTDTNFDPGSKLNSECDTDTNSDPGSKLNPNAHAHINSRSKFNSDPDRYTRAATQYLHPSGSRHRR